MYEQILEEMEARGMLKEAKESKQSPWRDVVLGAGGAGAAGVAGGLAGTQIGMRSKKDAVQRAMNRQAHAKDLVAKSNRPWTKLTGRQGHYKRKADKAMKQSLQDIKPALKAGLKGGGRGLAAGAALGGLAGVAASRFMGREKKASSQDELEQAILFAAFEDELEKMAGKAYSMMGNFGKGSRRGIDLTPGVDTLREQVSKGAKWGKRGLKKAPKKQPSSTSQRLRSFFGVGE